MTAIEARDYMAIIAKYHPDAKLTFANNKVEATKIIWDEKSQSINIR